MFTRQFYLGQLNGLSALSIGNDMVSGAHQNRHTADQNKNIPELKTRS